MSERFGLTLPIDPAVSVLEHRAWIEELPDLGFTDLWSGEVDGVDAFTPLVLASQWAPSLRLGPAIVPVYTRGPALLAQTAATMAQLAPRSLRSGYRIFVLPIEDADQARSIARRMIAQYLNVPVYAAFHRWLGREEQLAAMWKARADGDRKLALASIPDQVVDDLFAWGPPQRVAEQVQRYVDNGVTCPVLMLLGSGDPMPFLRSLDETRNS